MPLRHLVAFDVFPIIGIAFFQVLNSGGTHYEESYSTVRRIDSIRKALVASKSTMAIKVD